MGDVIFEAAILGLASIALLAYWYRKQQLKSYLFNHVSWCVVENKYNEYISSQHLLDHICHIRWNSTETSSIGEKYYIGRDDEEFALDILDTYRAYLSETYFRGNLKIECAKLSSDEYFMLTLCNYLENRECRTNFNENVMYNQLERTNYGTWGNQLYTATYELTTYGVVFNKILYIARIYCENNKHINKKRTMLCRSKDIKERLDSNKITISVL